MQITRKHGWGYLVGLILLSLLYCASGLNHLLNPKSYLAVMPSYIPSPALMVWVSGLAELLGGIGVLIPDGFVFRRTRRAAAYGLVVLLVAVSPVHINMCLHPEFFRAIPVWAIWLRLPLQLPLMYWAWRYARD